MAEKRGLLDRALGLEEKRAWRAFEARAKALPAGYYEDYKQMQRYLWLSGLTKWADFKFVFEQLLDLLEELAAQGRMVTEVTGPDVAGFLDQMANADALSWEGKQRAKLNKKIGANQ